jgi:hypothetical protein
MWCGYMGPLHGLYLYDATTINVPSNIGLVYPSARLHMTFILSKMEGVAVSSL